MSEPTSSVMPSDGVLASLRRGETTATELTKRYLARIERHDGAIGAFFSVSPNALADAAAADAQAREGRSPGPLCGLPVGIKDNIDTAGLRTTVGSSFFVDHVPAADAEVVARLRGAGAVILGKLALHEFAYGSTCENRHVRSCRNPWDLARIPGGSSGGSAAALAAELCAAALGTDTGGSVRIPGALNGVAALRPTQGAISNRGVFPITWSFDTVGPMARSVADVAALAEVLAGFDRGDPGSRPGPSAELGYEAALRAELRPLRVGLPTSFYFDEVDAEIVGLVRAAADVLASLGLEPADVDLPGAEDAQVAATRIIWAEALAIHEERLASAPERFGEDVRTRLRSGERVSGVEFGRMLQRAREWRRSVEEVFERFDLLLVPTTGVVAPLAAQSEMIETTRRLTRLTYGFSLAGLPVLDVPCGFSSEGLPVGMQLVAPPWGEATLLAVGAAYQRATDWHRRTPPLAD